MVLYPPILAKTSAAFDYLEARAVYIIKFSLPSYQGLEQIGHIQIRINQRDGGSIANFNKYPDGVIYKDKSFISREGNQYYISVASADLGSNTWEPGQLYKIQMRFGASRYNETEISQQGFYAWKEQQIAEGGFSEWSNIMITKAIEKPQLAVNEKNLEKIETTTTPLFFGSCELIERNSEAADSYKFDLYDVNDNLIESSSWLSTNSYTNSFRFKNKLINQNDYKVVYSIKTANDYIGSSPSYEFTVFESLLEKPNNIDFYIKPNAEDASLCAIVSTIGEPLVGTYVISRSSNKSNFILWEDIKFIYATNEFYQEEKLFEDFTIENGIVYQYAIQKENASGIRTTPILSEKQNVYFEYDYLVNEKGQLKLKYDAKISSFKNSVLESKQDSISSTYATLMRNGQSYYAQFPIAGLITINQDLDSNTLFTKDDRGNYYYDKELVFSLEEETTREGDKISRTSLFDLEPERQVFIEKLFREKVEEFLNDGSAKLFRSSTEGNIVVGLQGISLSPKEELNRLIYSFSATAYEIADSALETLDTYNILDIKGEQQETEEKRTEAKIGQISGLFSTSDNLIDFITDNCKQIINEEGYGYQLYKLKSISIQLYPKVYLEKAIAAIEAQISINPTDELLEEKTKLENLKVFLESSPDDYPISLLINGNIITIGKNKKYVINVDAAKITQIKPLMNVPLVVDYAYDAEFALVFDSSVQAIKNFQDWNQLFGVFTESLDVLTTYNYRYNLDESYRVIGIDGVATPSYNVYETQNILTVIEEQMKEYANKYYDFTPAEIKKNKYILSRLNYLEVEAEPGTVLIINEDSEIRVGPSKKLIINPSLELINSVKFKEPAFALVAYKAGMQIQSYAEEGVL